MHIREECRLNAGVKVTTMTYDMEKFLKLCVDLSLELAPPGDKVENCAYSILD